MVIGLLACGDSGTPPAPSAKDPGGDTRPARRAGPHADTVELTLAVGDVRWRVPPGWAQGFSEGKATDPRPGDSWTLAQGHGSMGKRGDPSGSFSLELITWDVVLTADSEESQGNLTGWSLEDKRNAVALLERVWDARSDGALVDTTHGTFTGRGPFFGHRDHATFVHAHTYVSAGGDDLRGILLVGTEGQEYAFAPKVTLWLGRPSDRMLVHATFELPELDALAESAREDGPKRVAGALAGGDGPLAEQLATLLEVAKSVRVGSRGGDGSKGNGKGGDADTSKAGN